MYILQTKKYRALLLLVVNRMYKSRVRCLAGTQAAIIGSGHKQSNYCIQQSAFC